MGELLAARLLIADDPAGAFLRAAGQTLLYVAVSSVVAGLGCALLAAAAIYSGCTRVPPRVPLGRIWAEWRRRPFLWIISLLLAAGGAGWAGEALARRLAAHDLYWISRGAEILRIGMLGGLTGYVLGLLLMVLFTLAMRRHRRPA